MPVLKSGVLQKNAIVKKRSFVKDSYKARFFELTEDFLSYYDGDYKVSYQRFYQDVIELQIVLFVIKCR